MGMIKSNLKPVLTQFDDGIREDPNLIEYEDHSLLHWSHVVLIIIGYILFFIFVMIKK